MKNENLFNAIGNVSDEKIAEAEAYMGVAQVRRRRWQFMPLAAAALLIAVGTVFMLRFLAPPEILNPPIEPFPVPGLTWLAELDYDKIEMCNCGYFFAQQNGEWFTINTRTGETADVGHDSRFKDCMTNWYTHWYYESEGGLFGNIHGEQWAEEVYAAFFPPHEANSMFSAGIKAVERIRSVGLKTGYDTWRSGAEPDIIFTGEFAVFYGGEFLTDFIYTGMGAGRNISSVVSLINSESKHGIIDKNGEESVPFIFDEILIISHYTAFAKLDGRWGIISFGDSPQTDGFSREMPCGCELIEAVVWGYLDPTFIMIEVTADSEAPADWRYRWQAGYLMSINTGENVTRLVRYAGDWQVSERVQFYVGDTIWVWVHVNADDPWALDVCQIGLIHRPPAPAEKIEETPAEKYEPLPPPELIYEAAPLPAHLENLNWVVRPGFKYTWHAVGGEEYESFHYCNMCGYFFGASEHAIDERTGLYVDSARHGAHGGGGLGFIYDPVLDLMGVNGSEYSGTPLRLYPRSEFTEHFPEAANTLMLVRSVDSTVENEHEWSISLPWQAFIGRGMAVAVGNEFITDFVYNFQVDSPDHWRWFYRGRTNPDKIEAADVDGKYGVIGRDGSVILPFEFEGVMIIDNWTAFVQYGERWGIVAFEDGDVPDFRPSGENHTYIDGDWLNERWQVVYDEEYKDFSLQNSSGERFLGLSFEALTNHGGRNIRTTNGEDVFWIRAVNEELVLNQVRLSRDWFGEVILYNHTIDDLEDNLAEVLSAAINVMYLTQRYLNDSGRRIHTENSFIQFTMPYNGVIPEAVFSFSLAAVGIDAHEDDWGDLAYFEAVNVNGAWEVHDVTEEIWEQRR